MHLKGGIMKKILIFSFFFLSTLGCQDDLNNGADDFTIVTEDHSNNQYQFPTGIYYEYVLDDADSYSFDELNVLNDLRNCGITLKDAWFKHYSSSCTPPGSNVSFQVIVRAEFIVRLNNPDLRLDSFGFIQTSNPSISACAYYVKHYIY